MGKRGSGGRHWHGDVVRALWAMNVPWDTVGHTRRGSQSLKRDPNMLFMPLFVKKAHMGAISFLKEIHLIKSFGAKGLDLSVILEPKS